MTNWNKDNCQEPQDVMTKLPNELGIYDMCGNLKEYVRIVMRNIRKNHKLIHKVQRKKMLIMSLI